MAEASSADYSAYHSLTKLVLDYIAKQEPKVQEWFEHAHPEVLAEDRTYKVTWYCEANQCSLTLYSDGHWALEPYEPFVTFQERKAMGKEVYEALCREFLPDGWDQMTKEGKVLPLGRKDWVTRMTKCGVLGAEAIFAVRYFQELRYRNS